MNFSIIIGFILAVGMVFYGMISGTDDLTMFWDLPSVFITIGGSIGVMVASFPLETLKQVPKTLKIAVKPKKFNYNKYISDIVEYAKIARGKGLIALESSANECKDPFLKSGLLLIIDANDTEKVRDMLDDAIGFMSDRHERGRAFYEKGVGIFPAFGMLGTLVGLVIMLNSMGENPDDLGGAMAVAIITTFYGSFFANIVCAPISNALKNAHDDEVLCMQIIQEGVIAIAEGSNPRHIQEKLEFMIPKAKNKGKEMADE